MVQLSNPYMTTGKTIALDLCQQSDVSAFEYAVWVCHSFSPKEQAYFNFTVAVTIHNDSGAQENKICQCLQFFPSICHEIMALGSSPVAQQKGVHLQ